MTVYLIGFMGCGKSSTGRRVARALGYAFADTDRLVEEAAGKSIARIFAEEGEAAFRQLETEVLAASAQDADTVVATGGGLPCNERNLALMRERGRIVYLSRSQERLVQILLACRRDRRPRIAGLDEAGIREYVAATLRERLRFYSQADLTIACDGKSNRQITDRLIRFIRSYDDRSTEEA